MAEIDPKVRQIRRIGVGVFLAAAAAAVPIGMHIHSTSSSPELGLTLLGAVLLLVLIALFALETAVTPIPDPQYTEEDARGLDLDPTELEEPDSHPTQMQDPPPNLADLTTEVMADPTGSANPDGPMLVVPNPSLSHAETRLFNTELNEDDDA